MNIKRVAGLSLIILSGVLGWSNTFTGAVIGTSSISSLIPILIFITGLALVLSEARKDEGGLAKEVENEARGLLKQRHILTRYGELTRLAQRMGYRLEDGSNHTKVYDGNRHLITTIPRHADVNRNTARGIMRDLAGYSA